MTANLPPQSEWVPSLRATAVRLSERLHFLGLRAQRLGPAAGTDLAMLVADAKESLEDLHAAEEELRLQGEQLAGAGWALEAARRRYQQLFDFAPDALLLTDPAGLIREANHAVSRLLGHARNYAIGKPILAYIHPAELVTCEQKLAAVRARSGYEPVAWETRFRPRRGDGPIAVSVRVAAARNERGALVGLRWAVRDISAQAAALAELEEQRRGEERRVRARTAELEALLKIRDRELALERDDHARLRTDLQEELGRAVQALQHGAEPRALLGEVLDALRASVDPAPGATSARRVLTSTRLTDLLPLTD
jgi:PAS domain S-box-containing protein